MSNIALGMALPRPLRRSLVLVFTLEPATSRVRAHKRSTEVPRYELANRRSTLPVMNIESEEAHNSAIFSSRGHLSYGYLSVARE